LAHTTADIVSPEARRALDGADILYHLAAQVWPGRGDAGLAVMHAANVLGTANVVAANVGALVLASSAAVYGSWPDNPLPMDEAHTPRPNAECPYAQHKLLAERTCAELAAMPWCGARLCAVLGPHADARVARSLSGYRWAVPAVRGVAQAVQWLDEEDAVSGLLAAGTALVAARDGVAGQVFNVAPADWLSAPDVAALSRGRLLEVSRSLLMAGSRLGHRLGLTPFGADRAVLIDGPLAMSTTRTAQVLGWRASHSSAEVLGAALRRGWRGAPLNRRPG